MFLITESKQFNTISISRLLEMEETSKCYKHLRLWRVTKEWKVQWSRIMCFIRVRECSQRLVLEAEIRQACFKD